MTNFIRGELHKCTQNYNTFGDRTLSYEDVYQSASVLPASEITGARHLTDLVTLIAWTTDSRCIQELALLSMNDQPHAFRLHFVSGCCSTMHTHDYIELMYVLEGQVTQNIKGQNVSFSRGEICLVNPSVEHCEYLFSQDCTVLWLGIDDIFFEKYETSKDPSDYTQSLKKLINQKRSQYLYIRFTPIAENTRTTQAFLTIFSEMLNNLPGKTRLIIGYVERIVDLLTKEYHFHISQTDQKELHRAVVLDICDYISANFLRTSVTEIASIYHYSPDYLNRIFARETGRTISSYLQKIRMEHAMRIIQTTDLSIDQVARQAGYHNMGFFYKKFKEFYLTTPDAARKQYRAVTSPSVLPATDESR